MERQPQFVAFNGSPRKHGNTRKLLEFIIQGVKKEGGVVKIFDLIDIPMRYCLGHYSESKEECNPLVCTEGELADGMKGIFQSLLVSDGLVIATPVYWFQVSGLIKTLLDRITALENSGRLLEGKIAGICAVCEEEGAISALMPLMATLNDMGMLLPPYSLVYHSGRHPVTDDPESVRYAIQLGRNMVRLYHLIGNRTWSIP